MKKAAIVRKLTVLLLVIALTVGTCAVFVGCNPSESDTPDPPAATLKEIKLDTSGAKTVFEFAEPFSFAGLKVTAVMSDGTEKDVALKDCRITAPDTETPGKRNVVVTYSGKTARYTITVKERVFPEITGDPLLTVAEKNMTAPYRVEGEAIAVNMDKVTLADGFESFVADAPEAGAPVNPVDPDENEPETTAEGDGEGTEESEVPVYGETSGGKFLTGYGVRFNYFGFKIDSKKQFTGVTMVMRLANGNETNIDDLSKSLHVYLNREVVEEDGEDVVKGLMTNTATIDAGYCDWRDIVFRNVTLKEGMNVLSIDALGDEVPDIDYIDFYVGMPYISAFVELNAVTEEPMMVDLEDFDTEKASTRKDWADANKDKIVNGLGLETVTKESAGKTTSRGTSVAALNSGSILSTTLRLPEKATVQIFFVGASVASYVVKSKWEFYIGDHRLRLVADTDIVGGNPGAGEWWDWIDVDLGTYNIEAGDHLFSVNNVGGSCNIDGLKFNVISVGKFDESGTDLDKQPHDCSQACQFCGKCTDTKCTHGSCLPKCEGHHEVEEICMFCGGCVDEDYDGSDPYIKKCSDNHIIMEAESLDGSTTNKRTDFGGGTGFNVGGDGGASGGQSTYGFTGAFEGAPFEYTAFAVKITVTEECTTDIGIRLHSDKTDTFGENFEFLLDGNVLTQFDPDASMTPNDKWHNEYVAKGVQLTVGEHIFVMKVLKTHFDFDCIFFDFAGEVTATPFTVAATAYEFPAVTEPEQPQA